MTARVAVAASQHEVARASAKKITCGPRSSIHVIVPPQLVGRASFVLLGQPTRSGLGSTAERHRTGREELAAPIGEEFFLPSEDRGLKENGERDGTTP